MKSRRQSYAWFVVGILVFLGLIVGIRQLAGSAGSGPAPVDRSRAAASGGGEAVVPDASVASGETAAESPAGEAPVIEAEETPAVETADRTSPGIRTEERASAGPGAIVGRVTRNDGVPAVGATVFATPVPGRDAYRDGGFLDLASRFRPGASATLARTSVDGTGAFRLTGVPDGEVLVVARLDGYARAAERVEVPEAGEAEATLSLRAAGFVGGRVLDANGEPVAGATVDAYAARSSVVDGVPGRTETGSDGSYALDGLEEERPYVLVARKEGFAPAVRMGMVPSTEGIDLTLRAGVRLAGVVRDAETGDPVPDPRIRVRSAPGRSRARGEGFITSRLAEVSTGEEGTFTVTGLAPGIWVLRVTADGYGETTAGPLELEGGQAEESIEVELVAGASVSGVVRDAESGRAVDGAVVLVVSEMRRMPVRLDIPEVIERMVDEEARATSADGGAFTIPRVPAGQVRLRAVHEAYQTGETTVRVEPGEDREDVELAVAPGARVVGTVYGEDGRPTDEFRVAALGSGAVRGAEPSEDGTYRIGGLGEGSFDIRLMAGRFRTLRSHGVQLSEGEEVRVDFRLEPPVRVSGLVTRDGQPAAEVRVALRLPSDSPMGTHRSRSDENGRYVIEEVPPGTYELTADGSRQPGTVEVPSGVEEHVLDVDLPGGSIEGRVVDAVTGEPVERAAVTVFRDDDDDDLEGYVARERTDAEGRYLVRGLTEDAYRVTASDDGYAQAERSGVEVRIGETVRDVDLELAGGATIAGVVTGPEGPVGGAAFWLERVDTGTPDVGSLFESTSDAEGSYEIVDISPGTYRLTATSSDLPCRTVEVEVRGDRVTADIAIPAGATLDLAVRDATGAPVEGAEVVPVHLEGQRLRIPILSFGDEGSGPTDENGRFLRTRLPPGPYRIEVTHPGAGSATTEVGLPEGGAWRGEITLGG